ncbi:MAG: tetratricopeptide repeat protein [Simkaniaceae bacterium]|nr:tetratricopeptide repeat protein [Simkaniaceae bacterium]
MSTLSQRAELNESIEDETAGAIKRLRRVTSAYLLFHVSMVLLVVTEWIALTSLIVMLPRSGYVALCLAGLFLTVFSYLVLAYYYQAKKPEQLMQVCGDYLTRCRQTYEGMDASTHHLGVANSAFRLFHTVGSNQEAWHFLGVSASLHHINQLLHWKDQHLFQEMLMMVVIDEHIQLIKKSPTDFEAHTSLVNAFIALAKLYRSPKWFWTFSSQKKEDMVVRHERALGQAVEELKIIDIYAPNDPWVHATLASCFHHLDEPAKEIGEYEILMRLKPDDHDVTLRLGLLYFESGRSAEALKIYEKLSRFDMRKAQELISHYDHYIKSHLSV